MRFGADREIHIGFFDAKIAEKTPRHHVIVMLPGMDDDLFVASGPGRTMDGRQFRKVRPCADDVKDLHGVPGILGRAMRAADARKSAIDARKGCAWSSHSSPTSATFAQNDRLNAETPPTGSSGVRRFPEVTPPKSNQE